MQNKQAIFIIGGPGSGKDVVIRDIKSNHNIIEFTSTQLDEMLSNDVAFKRATDEKRDSLLESKSILVTGPSFNLSFVVTKDVLESIGYSTHLILVEANLSVAFDRLKNRSQIQESLDRISIGNNNKNSILSLFSSNIIVDNSESLDLSESRKFSSTILTGLDFHSNITLEDLEKDLVKKKIKFKSKIIPLDTVDTRGSMGGIWSLSPGYASESIDFPLADVVTPVASGPMQQIKGIGSDMRSDLDKARSRKVLSAVKSLTKSKKVVPYGIE